MPAEATVRPAFFLLLISDRSLPTRYASDGVPDTGFNGQPNRP
jgi:hypothetical protein